MYEGDIVNSLILFNSVLVGASFHEFENSIVTYNHRTSDNKCFPLNSSTESDAAVLLCPNFDLTA